MSLGLAAGFYAGQNDEATWWRITHPFGDPAPTPTADADGVGRITEASYKQYTDVPQFVRQSTGYTRVDPRVENVDVGSLIRIHSSDDVVARRVEMVRAIWGDAGSPAGTLPLRVEHNIATPDMPGLAKMATIDRLTVDLDSDLRSIAYHFRPHRVTQPWTIIYHEGHGAGFEDRQAMIERLVAQGYPVIGMSMPLMGMNPRPTVRVPAVGPIKLNEHDKLIWLDHPLHYFIDPVVAVLDYLQRTEPDRPVAMMGLSGGGWTTTVVAAIDTRVVRSYPVAGTQPIYLRGDKPWADFEQSWPPLYRAANTMEMHVLGSHGLRRAQMQVLNQYDACCFGGVGYQTYAGEVTRRVDAIGPGAFNVWIDDTHAEHQISDAALKWIISDLHAHEPVAQ
ncbi:MAG: hypothetical protein GC159_00455 [Phycisphaera sp.]|nr:hypothetical protein [Phycisphaera sp.]